MRWTVRDNGDRSTPRSPFGVTGELQAGQTGLVSLRARWYDPAQGRFLQRDSFTGGPTRPQSLNRYAYVENNPANWTDPSGRCVGWLWRDPTCQFIGRDRVLRGDLEWGNALDPLQVGLDVVGLVPGFGEPADGLNGGISLLRGDRVGAALSFGAMVPFAGWGATVAKWGRRGMRLGDAGRGVRQEVRLIGFRGIGFSPSRYSDAALQYEDDLIKAGHIGISLDRGRTIYGFHPTQAAIDQANLFAEGGALNFLRSGGALKGMVYNDTDLFRHAHNLSLSGQHTSVVQIIFDVSDNTFARIERAFRTQVEAGENLNMWYRFPENLGNRRSAPMPPACNNCATWPRTVGVPIAERTGQLREYIPILEDYGIPWP